MENILLNQKFSVLVLDDHKNWREFLTELLQEQFDVISASNYDDALEKIYDQKPAFHAVVTDMRLTDDELGNEDGLKLIEYLNSRGDETKTIVLTGYATISTVKRALSNFTTYDYLEKHPSDGSPFDIKKFVETVYHAALAAEKQRPDGGTNIHPDILLLESDPTRRKNLKESISNNGYNIYTPDTNETLKSYLKNDQHRYVLILLSESLLNDDLLDMLHLLHPDARIIMLTLQNIDPIFKAMRNYPILSAFNVHPKKFSSISFQEFVHSALAYGAVKHISVQIEERNNQPTQINRNESQTYELISGKTYQIKLSIQDFPTINTTSIWLSPPKEKKEKIQLHLFIHAKQIKLNPSSDAFWNISISNQRINPFKLSFTPQETGLNQIMLEIDQNHRWLARIIINLDIKL